MPSRKKKKVMKKKVAQKVEYAKGMLLPKSAPLGTEEQERLDRNRKRGIHVCMVVSGGLLEAAGALRRLRWALNTDLADDTKKYLDQTSGELLTRAMHAELEAFALRKPEERNEGGAIWQQVKPTETEFAVAFK